MSKREREERIDGDKRRRVIKIQHMYAIGEQRVYTVMKRCLKREKRKGEKKKERKGIEGSVCVCVG